MKGKCYTIFSHGRRLMILSVQNDVKKKNQRSQNRLLPIRFVIRPRTKDNDETVTDFSTNQSKYMAYSYNSAERKKKN